MALAQIAPPRRIPQLLAYRTCAAALMGLALVVGAAHGEQGELRLTTKGEATTGTLLLNASTLGKYVEAPRLATDVKISVSGPIARTQVTQRFENTSDQWVEGVYVFPLPDESAVDTLRMQIGDRYIEGDIKEKKEAKRIYEQAKREGRKASLLEQERPNLFTNSVANIGPGETVIVQIEYQETIRLADDQFSMRFPMAITPRFNPPAIVQTARLDADGSGFGALDPVPDRDRISPPVLLDDTAPINPVTLSVDLAAGFTLGDITSAYHDVSIQRDGAAGATLTLSDETVPSNRDFELSWTPKSGKAPSAALFKETIEGEPYYLLMVTPPNGLDDASRIDREIVFVIDTSGSMSGASIRQARESLKLAIERLQPGDTFNVIEFNSEMQALYTEPKAASPENLARALSWVGKLESRGGTQMLPALKEALIDHDKTDDRLRQVIFLTDGAIGNENQLFEAIETRRGDARVFTVGIGSAPNSFFMTRASEVGQGTFTHIGDISEVAERMGALFTKLETPAVTNLKVDWPKGSAVEVWPSPIPDIYKGETLVVAAQADAASGKVWVSGTAGNQPWKVALPIEAAADRAGVSKLWARKKIASLELGRARGTLDAETVDKSVLKVALAHDLVSRLTSLVAVDMTPSRPDGTPLARRDIPSNPPHGWDFSAMFADGIAPPAEMIDAQYLAPQPEADPVKVAEARARGIDLPQTATLSQIKLIGGGLAFVFGMFLMFGFGRRT